MKVWNTVLLAAGCVHGTTYMSENFDNDDWSNWVVSEWKSSSEIGKWAHTAGNWFVDASDRGIKTSEDARFYGLSAKLDQPFNNEDKDLIIQYLVKHEQSIDCGGAYIKLLPSGLDQSKFGGDSPYAIMFGPDICGSTKRTHAILNYARPEKEAVNMDHKENIKCETDEHAHLYTFILQKDNTYQVKIDNESVQSGSLAENWPFQPEKEVKDPEQSKPEEWVDDAKIPDPEDTKPEGYDDIPAQIPDPDAEKPEDWDDEDDGDWEPPMIDNPEYKGPWQPKLIDNPEYKGEWEHPMIPNPEYFQDDKMYMRCNPACEYVGFELWQVKSGTVFDDILITDDISEAETHAATVMEKIAALKQKKEEEDAAKAEKEAEEAKAAEEENKDDDDEEADDEEEVEEAETEKDEL